MKEGAKGQINARENKCFLKSGTYGQRAYFYLENKGNEKTWNLTLTFNKMMNTKIIKTHRSGPNTMKFVIPPGQVDVAWLKGIDFTKSLTFDWKLDEEWTKS